MSRTAVVVGAGLCGVTTARGLVGRRWAVTVLDKSPRLGGRMATRRLDLPGGGMAAFDHGCQHLRAAGPAFADLLTQLEAAGVVRRWAVRLPGVPGAGPFFVGTAGMRGVVEHLADGLDVVAGCRATTLGRVAGRWRVGCDTGRELLADSVVLTMPLPQALELAATAGVGADDHLRAVRYTRCLTGLGVPADPDLAAPPVRAEPAPFGAAVWVCDNAAKGVSAVGPAFTVFASPELSEQFADGSDRVLQAVLFQPGCFWSRGGLRAAYFHRWRYHRPAVASPDVFAEMAPGLFVAGDAFGPRAGCAEGAFLSGRAAAEAMS